MRGWLVSRPVENNTQIKKYDMAQPWWLSFDWFPHKKNSKNRNESKISTNYWICALRLHSKCHGIESFLFLFIHIPSERSTSEANEIVRVQSVKNLCTAKKKKTFNIIMYRFKIIFFYRTLKNNKRTKVHFVKKFLYDSFVVYLLLLSLEFLQQLGSFHAMHK